LTLEDEAGASFILSTAFLGFPACGRQSTRQRCRASRENILIGATHNTAGLTLCFPDQTGKANVESEYLESVCDKLAEAIKETTTRLKPADGQNRHRGSKGKIAYNYYAEQLYDPRMQHHPVPL